MKYTPRERFYYIGEEIPVRGIDRYRCLDATTKGVLQLARGRISFIMFIFCCCFLCILGRLFYLTIVNYQARSFAPSVLRTQFELSRRNIIDRNGTILATNLPTTDLSVNPQKIKNPEEVAKSVIAAIPGLQYDEVYEKLTSSGNFKYLKRNLTPAERRALLWIGNPYLVETPNEKRTYPQGNLFAHILGGVSLDNIGTAGLEKAYEEDLQSADVQLSLDLTVQGIVRKVLTNRIDKYKAKGGLGIVMNVQNGEVLASVSLPDYDPTKPADTKQQDVRFNKVSLGTYEFGSLFKLFNTAMALENKVIKVTDLFDAHKNSLKVDKKVIVDFNGGEDRDLTVPEILIHSSNIGSSRIALKAGREKQQEFLGRLGFYERLPLNIPERGITQFPPSYRWGDIATATIAYGYGVSITPLHLISAVSALVNGGYYHLPTFIKNGNQGKAEVKIVSPEVSEVMRHLMWAVVNWDIKEKDPIYGYAVGGKTGTANMIDEKTGKYDLKKQRTSFIGVFPMDKPKYAVLITIEDPQKIKENWYFNNAGWTAKPTGLEIISQIAPYLGIKPREKWEQPSYIENAIQISKEHKKR